jgi:hypothetical protein
MVYGPDDELALEVAKPWPASAWTRTARPLVDRHVQAAARPTRKFSVVHIIIELGARWLPRVPRVRRPESLDG